MKLQTLSKAFCPIALLSCGCLMAQEDSSSQPPAQTKEPIPATAEPEVGETHLPPAQPDQVFPADPSKAFSPETDSSSPAPSPAVEPSDSLTPIPFEPVQPVQNNVLPPAAPDEGGDEAAAGSVSSSTIGAAPDLSTMLGLGNSSLGRRDIATPEFVDRNRAWNSGLGFGGDFSILYDTNVYQSSGYPGRRPKDDDFVFGFTPYLAYASQFYGFTYLAKVIVDAEEYPDHSDLSAVGYAANLSIGYDSKIIKTVLDISQSRQSSIDRDAGIFVTRNLFKTDFLASYKFSPKTSIDGQLGYNENDPEQRQVFESSRVYANLAGSWQYSPLTKIGLGLGWSEDEGEHQATRDAIGPLVRLSYTFSKKLNFEGETGVNYVTYDTASSDSEFFWSGKLLARYTPNPFWAFNLSLVKDSTPDGSIAGSYRNYLALRAGVDKKIYDATLKVGFSYEQNRYVGTGGTSISGQDRDYYSLDLALSKPLYRDILDVEIFSKFSDEESDDPARSWSGSQYGVALKSKF